MNFKIPKPDKSVDFFGEFVMYVSPNKSKKNIYNQLVSIIVDVSSMGVEALNLHESNECKKNIRLVDLGVNSIDYVEILYRFMDAHGAEFSIEKFSNVNQITDVVDLIYQSLMEKDT